MKSLSDITAPATVVRKLLEKDVQKQCVDWARARGYWARKFSSQSQRSVPDYLFAKREPPLKFACEFKKPTNTSTEAQLWEQQAMVAAGWFVFECASFEAFKQTVLRLEGMMEC